MNEPVSAADLRLRIEIVSSVVAAATQLVNAGHEVALDELGGVVQDVCAAAQTLPRPEAGSIGTDLNRLVAGLNDLHGALTGLRERMTAPPPAS